MLFDKMTRISMKWRERLSFRYSTSKHGTRKFDFSTIPTFFCIHFHKIGSYTFFLALFYYRFPFTRLKSVDRKYDEWKQILIWLHDLVLSFFWMNCQRAHTDTKETSPFSNACFFLFIPLKLKNLEIQCLFNHHHRRILIQTLYTWNTKACSSTQNVIAVFFLILGRKSTRDNRGEKRRWNGWKSGFYCSIYPLSSMLEFASTVVSSRNALCRTRKTEIRIVDCYVLTTTKTTLNQIKPPRCKESAIPTRCVYSVGVWNANITRTHRVGNCLTIENCVC